MGQVLLVVYLAGALGMLTWFTVVNLRFRRRVMRTAEPLPEPDCPTPVWFTDQIASPCVAGLFRPVILLTPACAADPEQRKMVLLHEQTHLAQGDPIWSHLRCLCLCLHWYNPLVWLAAVISRQDCELSCDEEVMARLNEQERLVYGRTLVSTAELASHTSGLLQTTTAMGESKKQIRHRILRIARRPKTLILAAAATVCVLALTTGAVFTGAAEIVSDLPRLIAGETGATLVIPEGMTEIPDGMFADDTSFSSVIIPAGVTRIGESAFAGCVNLRQVTLPESVSQIGSGAFAGCESLTGVTLPSRLDSMGPGVFENCTALKAAILPEGLTAVPSHTFSGCGHLRSVTIPEGVTEIEKSAFVSCADLKNVQLPASLTHIGGFAFLGCNSVTELVIPSGVTTVEQRAFANCTGLKTVTIPDSVEFLGFGSFFDCPKLDDIYYTGSIHQWQQISREQGLFIVDQSVESPYHQSVHIHYDSAGAA